MAVEVRASIGYAPGIVGREARLDSPPEARHGFELFGRKSPDEGGADEGHVAVERPLKTLGTCRDEDRIVAAAVLGGRLAADEPQPLEIGDGTGEADARLIAVSPPGPLLQSAASCARGAPAPRRGSPV